MSLPTDATTTRVVSRGSEHSHGPAAGSPDANINQPDIWNQPEAPHLIATDAFAFQLSAKRLFSLGCQAYTTQSAWRAEQCVKKLNNLGVWARQKFPSIVCQLKPTPGKHFVRSSRITVVRYTWLDHVLQILGGHALSIFANDSLLELTV